MIIHSRLIYIAMGRRQRYHTDRGVRPLSNDEDLAPDYTPQKRKTRKKRPGQHPPMARVNEGDEERDESAMHFDCEDATREMRKKESPERKALDHVLWPSVLWPILHPASPSLALQEVPRESEASSVDLWFMA